MGKLAQLIGAGAEGGRGADQDQAQEREPVIAVGQMAADEAPRQRRQQEERRPAQGRDDPDVIMMCFELGFQIQPVRVERHEERPDDQRGHAADQRADTLFRPHMCQIFRLHRGDEAQAPEAARLLLGIGVALEPFQRCERLHMHGGSRSAHGPDDAGKCLILSFRPREAFGMVTGRWLENRAISAFHHVDLGSRTHLDIDDGEIGPVDRRQGPVFARPLHKDETGQRRVGGKTRMRQCRLHRAWQDEVDVAPAFDAGLQIAEAEQPEREAAPLRSAAPCRARSPAPRDRRRRAW